MIPRRHFLQGVAALAAIPTPILRGKTFDLAIGRTQVNLSGRPATATTVNNSLPAPTLHWRQGETVTLRVTNTLAAPTSIHWHGIRLPANMDGVPGLSFPGISPGQTFTYRFPVQQSGTYWYHSHSGYQEQQGLYGAIVIDPATPDPHQAHRDYTIILSDWTDADPAQIVSNLKAQPDYYDIHQRDAASLLADTRAHGLGAALRDRAMWGRMRMSATDIADVSAATYTYLLNGQPAATNWTGLFRPGERIRLRVVNAASMTFFDVRIPGLEMHIVQADGNDIVPVPVDEFRIAPAETYDVLVTPTAAAHTIFAQSEDRTGYARGTLATTQGATAAIPPMDPRPLRTMTDMGMSSGGMGSAGMAHAGMAAMPGMTMPQSMPGMAMPMPMPAAPMPAMPTPAPANTPHPTGIAVDNTALSPTNRLGDPGDGLAPSPRRVLAYSNLRATRPGADQRPPTRTITLHLTGNMERYIWGFDGRKYSQSDPIRLALGERVRFTLVNDTMMEHPIHLHGLWSELENGQDTHRPYKHTVIVQPGSQLSTLVTADTPGAWAFHCHLLYHMEMGMMRTVLVA